MPLPYNNTVCITLDEWEESGLNMQLYKSDKKRSHLSVVKGGGNGRPVLIDVRSIKKPERLQAIYKTFPSIANKGAWNFKNMVETDLEAVEFYASYRLADGRHLPAEKQAEYVANASVLNSAIAMANERQALRKALGGNTKGVWPVISELVNNVKAEFGHNLPGNHRLIQKKAVEYAGKNYMAFISGKWLNANAAKITDKTQEATMRQLIRKHQNLDNEQIASIYNAVAESLGWDTITAATAANYKSRWELETYSGRKGVTAFENNKTMLIKRTAPTYPLYYWTVDGWDAELLYQKTIVNKKGYSTTTFHNRLTIVVVLDPCCKYPVGYAIGTHETPELIKKAVRNAINHTRELFGMRYKVLQLQTDNYAKPTLLPTYEAISTYYTPARTHNAKSKVIEPYFRRLNKTYCQLMNNWSGFGVATGSKNQPNSEKLNQLRHSFPDEAGVRQQLEKIIEHERALTRDKYLELFNAMPETDRKPISDEEYLMKLGESTGFTNRLTASGLLVTIEGQKYEYDSFDPRFRQLSQMDWTVKYDPDDKSKAIALSADGTHRIMLEEKYVQPMALRERTEEDTKQLARVNQHNKERVEQITQGMANDWEEVDDLFAKNPQLNDTLAKLMLVDSTGQHKNRKSAARLGAAAMQIEETRKPKSMKPQQDELDAEREYLKSKIDIDKYF